MKKFFYLIGVVLSLPLLSCGQSGNKDGEVAKDFIRLTKVAKVSDQPGELFGLSDAEKILGEPARLSDSSTTIAGEATNFKCSYTANAADGKTGKTGVTYFLFEHYFKLEAAQERYSFIKTANEVHGIQELQGVGEEAYFHTDRQNFYFIMVRKGDRLFNMKVNKITSNTSLDEFNRVARKIAAAM